MKVNSLVLCVADKLVRKNAVNPCAGANSPCQNNLQKQTQPISPKNRAEPCNLPQAAENNAQFGEKACLIEATTSAGSEQVQSENGWWFLIFTRCFFFTHLRHETRLFRLDFLEGETKPIEVEPGTAEKHCCGTDGDKPNILLSNSETVRDNLVQACAPEGNGNADISVVSQPFDDSYQQHGHNEFPSTSGVQNGLETTSGADLEAFVESRDQEFYEGPSSVIPQRHCYNAFEVGQALCVNRSASDAELRVRLF